MDEKELMTEIENLSEPEASIWRNMSDAHKGELITLRHKLEGNIYFGKSKPPIDLAFLIVLNSQYPISHIRERVNRAYLWLVANPERAKKNYRRFLLNFMNDNKPQFIYQRIDSADQ